MMTIANYQTDWPCNLHPSELCCQPIVLLISTATSCNTFSTCPRADSATSIFHLGALSLGTVLAWLNGRAFGHITALLTCPSEDVGGPEFGVSTACSRGRSLCASEGPEVTTCLTDAQALFRLTSRARGGKVFTLGQRTAA